MKIWKRLPADHIFLDQHLADKDALLRFIAHAFARQGIVGDAEALHRGLLDRERTMSTGIGNGLALPHTANGEAAKESLMLVRLARPMEYTSLDRLPVDVVIALVVPAEDQSLHLRLLAALSRICREPGFMEMVRRASTSEGLWRRIRELEDRIPFH